MGKYATLKEAVIEVKRLVETASNKKALAVCAFSPSRPDPFPGNKASVGNFSEGRRNDCQSPDRGRSNFSGQEHRNFLPYWHRHDISHESGRNRHQSSFGRDRADFTQDSRQSKSQGRFSYRDGSQCRSHRGIFRGKFAQST